MNSIEIKKTYIIGDIIDCVTSDGVESGKIMAINEDSVTVYFDYIDEEREVLFKFIK